MREPKYEKLKVFLVLYVVVTVILAIMFSVAGTWIESAITLGVIVSLILWYPALKLQEMVS